MPPARPKRRTSWRSAARSSPQVGTALASLGKRVRILRQEKGLTQEDAAARAHLDPKHFQAIEAGKTNVTMASLVGIARSLGVKLAELLKGV